MTSIESVEIVFQFNNGKFQMKYLHALVFENKKCICVAMHGNRILAKEMKNIRKNKYNIYYVDTENRK